MTTDTRERFTFRIPSKLLKMLRREAQDKGVSLNALILQILWDWTDNQKSA